MDKAVMKTSWGKPVHVIAFIRTLLIVLAVAVCTVAAEDLEALRKKAEAGDAVAQFNLAGIYANGRGVAKNDAEAAKWCRMAAEAGDVKAQYKLGGMWDKGWGVPEDDAEARKALARNKKRRRPSIQKGVDISRKTSTIGSHMTIRSLLDSYDLESPSSWREPLTTGFFETPFGLSPTGGLSGGYGDLAWGADLGTVKRHIGNKRSLSAGHSGPSVESRIGGGRRSGFKLCGPCRGSCTLSVRA
jgi:hypothetical protein